MSRTQQALSWALKRQAIVVFVVAISFSGVINLFYPAPPAIHDALAYIHSAEGILTNGSFTFGEGSAPNAAQTPGYPLFLDAIFALTPHGDSWAEWAQNARPFVVLVQIALVGLIAAGSSWIGRRLYSDAAGLIGGLLGATYVPLALSSSVALSDLLGVALATACVMCAIKAIGESRRGALRSSTAALVGATAAVLTLVRPVYALWLIVPLGFTLATQTDGFKRWARWALIAVAAFAIVMSPWWARNIYTLDHLVLLNTNAAATGLDSMGGRTLTAEEAAYAEAHGLNSEQALSYAYRARLLDSMVSEPADFITSRAHSAWNAVTIIHDPIRDAYWEEAYDWDVNRIDFSTDWDHPDDAIINIHTAGQYGHWAILLLFVGGLFVRRADRTLVMLVASLAVYTIAVHSVTAFLPRYFLEGMVGVIPIAGVGVARGVERLRAIRK